jgi:signal transduction histidine kinase
VLFLLALLGESIELPLRGLRYTAAGVPLSLAAILLGPSPAIAFTVLLALMHLLSAASARRAPSRGAGRTVTYLLASALASVTLNTPHSAWSQGRSGAIAYLSGATLICLLANAFKIALAAAHARLERAVPQSPSSPAAPSPLGPAIVGGCLISVSAALAYLGHSRGLIVSMAITLVACEQLVAAIAESVTHEHALVTERSQRLRHGIQVREDERGKWARELHDDAIQSLGVIKMLLARARETQRNQQRRLALTDAVAELDATLATLRGLVSELRPVVVGELGLDAAIRILATRVSRREKIPVRVAIDAHYDLAPLHEEIQTNIYRVIQESLTNTCRYAHASTATVAICARR